MEKIQVKQLVPILVLIGCGLARPDFVDYEDGQGGIGSTTGTESGTADSADDGGTTVSAECKAAIEAFTLNIQPILDATCIAAGCHLTNQINAVTIKKGSANASANRKALLGFINSNTFDSTKFAAYMKSQHGGGDQSAKITETTISLWLPKESSCKE